MQNDSSLAELAEALARDRLTPVVPETATSANWQFAGRPCAPRRLVRRKEGSTPFQSGDAHATRLGFSGKIPGNSTRRSEMRRTLIWIGLVAAVVGASAAGAAGEKHTASPQTVGGLCSASGQAANETLAWLAAVPEPSPTPLPPAPTACGDCPGLCTSSPACGGAVIGDDCYQFGVTRQCKSDGSCAKYICCKCG